MEKTIHITGLTRQTKMALLPLPYFLVVASAVIFPVLWTEWWPWLITAPVWWLTAYVTTRINPNGHIVALTVLLHNPIWPLLKVIRNKGIRYVS